MPEEKDKEKKDYSSYIIMAVIGLLFVGWLWWSITSKGGSGSSNTADNTAQNCDIKGNINKEGEKIYHMPGDTYYDKTEIDTSTGERYFCSEGEAQRAGWRHSKI